MLIISDISPITNLIQIGHLDLLNQFFGQIIIPEKVYEELSYYENQKIVIDSTVWISVKSVKNKSEVSILEKDLDAGEAEAIVLAKELNANLLIIDERKGRQTAENYGLQIIGLLGILTQAKKKGFIKVLKPILDILRDEIGFRINPKLYSRILQEVKEL